MDDGWLKAGLRAPTGPPYAVNSCWSDTWLSVMPKAARIPVVSTGSCQPALGGSPGSGGASIPPGCAPYSKLMTFMHSYWCCCAGLGELCRGVFEIEMLQPPQSLWESMCWIVA